MVDRRERATTDDEMIRLAMDAAQAGLWTAMPGIIQSFNAGAMTCVVQVALQIPVRQPDGTIINKSIPPLLDCPVIFPAGGGFCLTFPLAKGDECLVLFASRCIDAWWQQGGAQPLMELRMHDLSDGFVLAGVFSQPRVLGSISAVAAQLRSKDGSTFVEVNAAGLKVHAGTVYEWDVQGYGQKITWTGGKNYTIDNYNLDAVITTNNHNTSPPGPP